MAAAASANNLDPDTEARITNRLTQFCEMKRIPTTGVLAITIQKNFTGDFCALIVDMNTLTIKSAYTAEDLSSYSEGRVDEFLYCYRADLDPSKACDYSSLPAAKSANVFCCDRCVPYKACSTAHEEKFRGLLAGKGDFPDIVFEVKDQIDHGPMLSTKYYSLKKDQLCEEKGPFKTKIHTFKNYKCNTHGRFFGVDLCPLAGEGSNVHNSHHMRLNPFTKVNEDFLMRFFRQAGIE